MLEMEGFIPSSISNMIILIQAVIHGLYWKNTSFPWGTLWIDIFPYKVI